MRSPLEPTAPAYRPNAEVQQDKRQMEQGPQINQAQVTADAALLMPPVGSLVPYAGVEGSLPVGGKWLLCDGAVVQQTLYPDLFSAIGATWNIGGEAEGTFRLPDARGRAAVGAGAGTGLTSRTLGGKTGAETHTLTNAEHAPHSHGGFTDSDTHSHNGSTGANGSHSHTGDTYSTFTSSSTFAGAGAKVGLVDATAQSGSVSTVPDHSHSIGANTHSHGIPTSGGGGAHNNMPPSFFVNWIIRAVY